MITKIYLKQQSIQLTWLHLLRICVGITVALKLSGCSVLPKLSLPEKQKPNLELQLQVKPDNQPGVYTITGSINIPDQSEIQVAVIRYLQMSNQASRNLNPKPTYALLAYQTAEVKQGKWKALVNLWKTAPDGRFQENWQLEQQKLKTSFIPNAEVVFLVTHATSHVVGGIPKFDQQFKAQRKTLENGVLLTTIDNYQYVQLTQNLVIPLPSGQTNQLPENLEDINGGWGKRYLMPNEPPSQMELGFPSNRRTNALPSLAEFVK